MKRDPLEARILERCLGIVNRSETRPLIEQAAAADKGTLTRMLGAQISTELYSKVDETVRMLGMTKREFVELAVIAAIQRVEAIADAEGVYETFELEAGNAQQAAA